MEKIESNATDTVAEDTAVETNTGAEKDTYTAAEVKAMLQSEADKRVSEALRKQEKTTKQKIAEAEKLAKMNEEQKYAYELEQREKLVAEKEAQLAVMENKNEASKILAEKGISLTLVDFIVAEDADTMMDNIRLLETAFKDSVKAEVEKRLKTSTPRDNLPSANQPMTREQYAKLSLSEMNTLAKENPSLVASFKK